MILFGAQWKRAMAWGCSGKDNADMVRRLFRADIIQSQRVRDTMLAVDRGFFCRSGDSAYEDAPQPIGFNVTISAPHMHSMCLERLQDYLHEGCTALDVGSGSGYLAACMALMCGRTGRAYGIDHIQELVDWSVECTRAAVPLVECLDGEQEVPEADELPEDCKGCVMLVTGDGRLGLPEHGPYDCIHVGAASEKLPQELVEQLKCPGRLIIPVGSFSQDLLEVTKDEKGNITERVVCGVRYVPLTDRESQVRGRM